MAYVVFLFLIDLLPHFPSAKIAGMTHLAWPSPVFEETLLLPMNGLDKNHLFLDFFLLLGFSR